MNRDLLECSGCLCFASRAAARAITAVYDKQLRPHGLRATQFTILSNLALRGGLSVNVLAAAMGMDRTTVTRAAALLTNKGWVGSRTDEADARSTILAITPAGETVIEGALPSWRKAQRAIEEDFGATGVAALKRLARAALS